MSSSAPTTMSDSDAARLPMFCPRCAARGPCACKRRPKLIWSKESDAQFNGFLLVTAIFLLAVAAYFASVAYEDGRGLYMVLATGVALGGGMVAWMFWDGANRVAWRFRAEDDSARGTVQTLDFEVVGAQWHFERTLELPLTVAVDDTCFKGTGDDLPDELCGELSSAHHDAAATFLATLFSMVASGALVMRARVRTKRAFPQTGGVEEEPWEVVVLKQNNTSRTPAEQEVLLALGGGPLPLTALVRSLRRSGAWDEMMTSSHDGNLAGFIDTLGRNLTIAKACMKNMARVL